MPSEKSFRLKLNVLTWKLLFCCCLFYIATLLPVIGPLFLEVLEPRYHSRLVGIFYQ